MPLTAACRTRGSRSARLVALLVGLWLSLALVAQQYGFTRLTPREGLAQSQVRCMVQDKVGYLWFGTLGGASRFDGQDFTNYSLRNGLPDPQVSALLAASDGTVWLACGSSLVRFDGHAMHTVPLAEGGEDYRGLALAQAGNGAIYLATDGAGLLQVRGGQVVPVENWPHDSVPYVRALLTLPDGRVMAGLRGGLLVGDDQQGWRSVPLPFPASISSLSRNPAGTIWAGTFGDGVLELRTDGTVQVHDEAAGLLQNNVRDVLADRKGRVWTATKFGMDLLEGNRSRVFTVHQGMPNDNVWCLLEDADGSLWIGTDGGGVLRYAGDAYVSYTVTEGLCSDLVMTGVIDHSGDLWLGTYGNGVCRMDGMAQVTTLEGLPNNTVWCGTAAEDGSLWFGTSDGLCQLMNGVVMPLDSTRALAGQRVLAIRHMADGSLWCGTRDGLAIVPDEGPARLFGEMHGETLRGVRSILEAPDHSIWLATDQGVVHLVNNRAERLTTAEGLSHNTVFSMAFDHTQRLWLGTSNGLTCLEAGAAPRRIDLGMDFGSNYVGLLLADGDGRLWAGSNNGLFAFRPDSLLADPADKVHITDNDGIRGMEFNLNSGFIDPRGRLFFGTNAGLVLHDPAQPPARTRSNPPIVHITGISNFLEPVAGADSLGIGQGPALPIVVDYRRNHLTFSYTAIALATGNRVRFQYRLAGFDQEWMPATQARFASYSNLPQGAYTFEVRAAEHPELLHGGWGPVASVEFTITPPFWLRWWFFVLCGALVVGIWFIQHHLRAVKRQRDQKTRNLILRSRMLQLEQQALNANMNRHFIFNVLNSIQFSINKQDRDTATRYLTSFAKLIRKNLDASQSDTTTLAEELERLRLYLELEHMRFKDKVNYAIRVEQGVDLHGVNLPAMMLQPYVENSIWHGILPMDRPGTVMITVAHTPDGGTGIRITDNGMGIDNSRVSKQGQGSDHISRGIEITKGRADVLRRLRMADIRIEGPEQFSDAQGNTGTRVSVVLPRNSPFPNDELQIQDE